MSMKELEQKYQKQSDAISLFASRTILIFLELLGFAGFNQRKKGESQVNLAALLLKHRSVFLYQMNTSFVIRLLISFIYAIFSSNPMSLTLAVGPDKLMDATADPLLITGTATQKSPTSLSSLSRA